MSIHFRELGMSPDRTRNEAQSHPHVPAERAELFRCYDSASTEVEYLELLRALVRCLKPEAVLETGAWNGFSTVVLADALRENCFGFLTSVEADAGMAERARERLCTCGLHNAIVHTARSTEFLQSTTQTFGMAFLDSDLDVRVTELTICMERGLLRSGAIVAIHDSSRHRVLRDGTPDAASRRFWADFEGLRERHSLSGVVEFPYSRGLLLLRV